MHDRKVWSSGWSRFENGTLSSWGVEKGRDRRRGDRCLTKGMLVVKWMGDGSMIVNGGTVDRQESRLPSGRMRIERCTSLDAEET